MVQRFKQNKFYKEAAAMLVRAHHPKQKLRESLKGAGAVLSSTVLPHLRHTPRTYNPPGRGQRHTKSHY